MIYLKNENLLINKEVNENLESILKRKLFANGYIFYGPQGIGKKETAVKFIKGIFDQYLPNSNIGEKIKDYYVIKDIDLISEEVLITDGKEQKFYRFPEK